MSEEINPITGLPPKATPTDTKDQTINPITGRPLESTGISLSSPQGQVDLSHFTKSHEQYKGAGWWKFATLGSGGVATHPFAGDWDDNLARRQNTASKWVNGTTKMLAGTIPGAVVENLVGPIYGLIGAPVMGKEFIWDNHLGRMADSWNDHLREMYPNYYTKAEMDPNRALFGWDSLGSANFWADKALNGAGYMLASIGTVVGTGGTGLISRGVAATAKATSKVAKASTLGKIGKFALDAEKAAAQGIKAPKPYLGGTLGAKGFDRIRQAEMALTMSAAEASIEAREIQRRMYDMQVQDYLDTYTGLTEDDIPEEMKERFKEQATAAGNGGYAANLAILSATNYVTFGQMLGPGFRSRLGIKGGKPHMDLSKRVGTRADGTFGVLPQTKIAGLAERAVPYARGSVSEAIQEGSQYGIGEYQVARRIRGLNAMEALNESFMDTIGTTDGQEATILGALIGSGGAFGQRLFHGSQTKRRNEMIDKAVKDMGIFQNLMSNIEVTEANAALIEMMEQAAKEGNHELHKDLQYTLIANNAARLQDVGLLDMALGYLEQSKSMSDEEFRKSFGYQEGQELPESKSAIIDQLKERIQKHAERRAYVMDNLMETPEMGALDEAYYRLTGQQDVLERKQQERMTAQQAKMFYANTLYNRLARLDGHNERLENLRKELEERHPELNLDSLEFEFDTLGAIEEDENGNFTLNDRPITVAELAQALGNNEQLKKLGEKMRKEGKLEELQDLYQLMLGYAHNSLSVAKTAEAVAQLQRLPNDSVGYYKMMNAMKEKQQKLHAEEQERQNNEETEQAIKDAKTPNDLENAVSPNATMDQKARAREKRDAMERRIEELKNEYLKLSDEDLFQAETESELGKIALQRAQHERIGTTQMLPDETAEQKAINEATGVTGRDNTPRGERQQQLEEAFDPANLGGVQIADETGGVFIIRDKVYYNHFSKPEMALERNEEGQIISVTLHDESGNRRVFREEATVDAVAFAILAAINSTKTSTTAEQRELAAEEVKEKAEAKETMDENADLRSNDQLQAELLELNADLKEVTEVLDELVRYYKDLGFTAKEINEDEEVQELRRIKRSITNRITYRAKKMRQRLGRDNDVAETKKGDPYRAEVQKRIEGVTEQMEKIENEIAKLVDFRDNGKYNPEDREFIQKEIKRLRDKKYRLSRKLKVEKEKLVNHEEQAAEKSTRPAEQSAERTPTSTEGQIAEGEESDTPRQRDTEEVDLSQEAQERRIDEQQAQEAGTSPQSDTTGEVSTKEERPVEAEQPAEMQPLSSNLKNQKGELETAQGYRPIGELDADGNVVLKERSARAGQERQLLNDPNIGPGTEVEFVLLDQFDEETVGIQLAGTNTIIGNLSKNDSAEYDAIVKALRAGEPASAKITNKVFNNNNITTVVDQEGNALFMPVDLESFEGARLGVLMGEQTTGFYYYFREELSAEEQEEVNAHIFRHKESVKPGTVVMLMKSPNGKPQVLYLSTRQLTPAAVQAVLGHIDNGEATAITEIVGFNKIPMDKDMELHFDDQAGLFNMSLGNGLYVTINMKELSKLLKGQKAKYSFSKIDEEGSDQGFGILKSIPLDQRNYENFKPEAIKQMFMDTLKQRRFNVNPGLMTAEGTYTDKFTGQTHPSYYHYLTAPIGLEERTEGSGHNAILTRRFAKRGAGVHFDITLEFGDITTPTGVKPADEAPVQKDVGQAAERDAAPAAGTREATSSRRRRRKAETPAAETTTKDEVTYKGNVYIVSEDKGTITNKKTGKVLYATSPVGSAVFNKWQSEEDQTEQPKDDLTALIESQSVAEAAKGLGSEIFKTVEEGIKELEAQGYKLRKTREDGTAVLFNEDGVVAFVESPEALKKKAEMMKQFYTEDPKQDFRNGYDTLTNDC